VAWAETTSGGLEDGILLRRVAVGLLAAISAAADAPAGLRFIARGMSDS
jgi:hypothetical protein